MLSDEPKMSLSPAQQEAYLRAARLCSSAEKSPAGISQKLLEWGLGAEETVPVLQKLRDEKFIDETRYARSFVHDKFRFNRWGRIKISFQLKAEKISGPVIGEALGGINETEYREVLVNLVREKNKSIRGGQPFERKAKLYRFAQSRGFEPELIASVIKEFLEEPV